MIVATWTKVTITFYYHPEGRGSDLCVLCDEELGRAEQLNLFDLLGKIAEHQYAMVLSTPDTSVPSEAGR